MRRFTASSVKKAAVRAGRWKTRGRSRGFVLTNEERSSSADVRTAAAKRARMMEAETPEENTSEREYRDEGEDTEQATPHTRKQTVSNVTIYKLQSAKFTRRKMIICCNILDGEMNFCRHYTSWRRRHPTPNVHNARSTMVTGGAKIASELLFFAQNVCGTAI